MSLRAPDCFYLRDIVVVTGLFELHFRRSQSVLPGSMTARFDFDVMHVQTIPILRGVAALISLVGLRVLFGLGIETIQTSGHTNSTHLVHRPASDIIPPLGGELAPIPICLSCLCGAAASLVRRNSVPLPKMRYMIMANRRAGQ